MLMKHARVAAVADVQDVEIVHLQAGESKVYERARHGNPRHPAAPFISTICAFGMPMLLASTTRPLIEPSAVRANRINRKA